MEQIQQPTPRQLEMISLCARGCSREEIGRELYVSPWTVKVTLDELRRRLEAKNITHAVTICLIVGWLVVVGDEILVSRPRELAAA